MDKFINLSWKNHNAILSSNINIHRLNNAFCDATVACSGKYFQVHKLVLSTFSDYFKEIFEMTPCKHPFVIVQDIPIEDLQVLLDFIYLGEVAIPNQNVPALLSAAHKLRIMGLCGSSDSDLERNPTESFSKLVPSFETDSTEQLDQELCRPVLRSMKKNVQNDSYQFRKTTLNFDKSIPHSQIRSSNPNKKNKKINLESLDTSGSENKIFISKEFHRRIKKKKKWPLLGKKKRKSLRRNESTHGKYSFKINKLQTEQFEKLSSGNINELELTFTSVSSNDHEDIDIAATEEPSINYLETEDPLENLNLMSSKKAKSFGKMSSNVLNQSDAGHSELAFAESSALDGESHKANLPNEQVKFEEQLDQITNIKVEDFFNDCEATESFIQFPNYDSRGSVEFTVHIEGNESLECIPNHEIKVEPPEEIHKIEISEVQSTTSPAKITNYQINNILNTQESELMSKQDFNILKDENILSKGESICTSEHLETTEDNLKQFSRSKKCFKCSFCSFSSRRQSSMIIHLRTHTKEKPFSCQVCPFKSTQKSSLTRHLMTHKDKKEFKCSICTFRSKFPGAIKRHQSMHSTREQMAVNEHQQEKAFQEWFNCKICSFKTEDIQNLENHVCNHPKISNVEGTQIYQGSQKHSNVKMPDESVQGTEIQNTNNHIETSFGSTETINLKSLNELIQPEASFSKALKHKCKLCAFSSKYKFVLTRHMKIHSKDRPLKCPKCTHRFNKRVLMLNHIDKVHTKSNKKSDGIVKLERTLNKAGKHVCRLCAFSSKHKNVINKHMKLHSKARPLKCPKCTVRFNTKVLMLSHMKNVHTECNTAFKRNLHPYESIKKREFKSSKTNHTVCNKQGKNKRTIQVEKCNEGHVKDEVDQNVGSLNTTPKKDLISHLKNNISKKYRQKCAYITNNRFLLTDQVYKKGESSKKPKGTLIKKQTHSKNSKNQMETCLEKNDVNTFSNIIADSYVKKEDNIYACGYCSFEAKTKTNIMLHTRVHTTNNVLEKGKFFSCKLCSKNFTSKSRSLYHYRIHTGEKPFKCPYCPHSSRSKGNLTQHITKIHTREKPLKRTNCLHSSRSKGNLTQNTKTRFKIKSSKPSKSYQQNMNIKETVKSSHLHYQHEIIAKETVECTHNIKEIEESTQNIKETVELTNNIKETVEPSQPLINKTLEKKV